MKRVLLVMACFCLLLATGCQSASETAVVSTYTPAPTHTPAPTPTPTPEPTAEPTPTPAPEPTRVTIMAVGDLLCLSAQLSAAKSGGEYNFDYCFEPVKDTISSADLAIGNLETLLADGYPYTASSSDNVVPTPTPGESASAEPTVAPSEPAVTEAPPADTPTSGVESSSTTEANTQARVFPALEGEAPRRDNHLVRES